ncbi:MAG: 3-deoxy-8-phosphooctulonate synthase [Rickettsiales bacterium]|nr:3-deoxy-8-phosphooctulonate synthase [Rickettsiales bacterium]
MAVFAGPCQIESLEHTLFMVEALVKITSKLDIPFIYKSSFDKANRSSVSSQRGVGIEKSMEIFSHVKEKFGCPIVTDVHTAEQCNIIANYVDVLQIPAFLCRQTDLLKAAADTGKVVKVKKGQFLAPWDIENIIDKFNHFGHKDLLITERGTSFGYNTLVSDMRGIEIMKDTGVPVIFDATHSVQQPGGKGKTSGGDRRFVETLARAALAVGVAGVFLEVHQDPDNAPSDGPNMVILSRFESLMRRLMDFDKLSKSFVSS